MPATDFHRTYYSADPLGHREMREFVKFAPRLQHLIYGKRYILPNYRNADYYPQHGADVLFSGNLLDPIALGRLNDDVANCAYTNALRAMSCGRPQLWLEKELAEAFMRSQLPGDFEAADVKWRWPGMRIHLPKGILRIVPKAGAREHDLMYLDICHVPCNQVLSTPEPYLSEIAVLAKRYGWAHAIDRTIVNLKTTAYNREALMISGNLDGPRLHGFVMTFDQEAGDYMIYGVVKPFDDVTLQQIARVTGTRTHLASPYESTEDDDRFCERILHLGLQCLLYLGSMPLVYEAEEVLRKAKMEGKRAIPALLRAKFVGQSQLRAQPAHSAQPVHPTGRHLPGHWKCGHWKRQPFGPKFAERKLVWIQPYQTHGPQDEKETVTGPRLV